MGDGGAGKREAERNRDVLREQSRQFDEAQAVLKKGTDESITDIEAADARLNGLITDEQEAIITTLNQGTGGAIETLRRLDEQSEAFLEESSQEISNNIGAVAALSSDEIKQEIGKQIGDVRQSEETIMRNVVETGLLAREALTDEVLQGISELSGFSKEAVASLQPFKEQGERSLLQARFLSGTATPEEAKEFEERFGGIESSPLVQARIEEEERAIGRQQSALGKRFSGLGQEEILERGSRRIREEELTRQLQTAQNLAGLGFEASSQISGIQQRTGQDVLGARTQLGSGLASQLQQEQGLGADVQVQALLQRNQLRSQLAQQLQANRARQLELQTNIGQQFQANRLSSLQQTQGGISNLQSGETTNVANLQQNLLNQRLNLGSQFTGARSNIRTGQASGTSNLIAQNALSQTQGQFLANQQQSGSESSFLRDVAGLGGQLGGAFIASQTGGFA